MGTRRGGKKGRKIGRNKKWCEGYRARRQREKNKARRLDRHIARHPHDQCASKARSSLGV